MATDYSYKDKNGERQKRTEWHRIVAWRKLAEIVQQYLKKGSLIYIEGRIETREWQDKEGQKRYTTEIIANEMRMLGGRGDGAAAGASVAPSAHRSDELDHAAPADDSIGSAPEIGDEDIPF